MNSGLFRKVVSPEGQKKKRQERDKYEADGWQGEQDS